MKLYILSLFPIILLSIFFVNPIYCFTPLSTYAHSSSLVNNKLYYFGGMNITKGSILSYNTVYYLDLSNNFTIASPPWTDLTGDAAIPFGSAWATTSIGGIDKSLIFLFGGYMDSTTTGEDIFEAMTYQFDTNTPSWSKSSLSGIEPARRREMQAVHDDNGRIYIFGGSTGIFTGASNTSFFNNMIIIDTISKTYSLGSSVNAPYGRNDYTATILPSGIIVYIGGREDISGNATYLDVVSISNISTYDTIAAQWETKSAMGGTDIDDRHAHSASLTSDGRIIVYGGLTIEFFTAKPQLIVLDTNTDPYQWIIPSDSGAPSPPALTLHTSNIVGDYMIIAFGNITSSNTESTSTGSGLYVLDTRNYSWTASYVASNSNFPPSNSTSNLSSAQIAGIVVGCVGALLLSILVAFGIYKVYKRHKENENENSESYIPTPGEINSSDQVLFSDTNQMSHL